ncbi:MAG: SDR family oxidoreductase [Phycisphaerales bacterium]|nr:SDR family oxidoreductase [Phycisphaerales bacterium]
MIQFSGRRALVCGSTQGIGRATADRLAGLGARITLLARDEQALAAVVAELPRVNGAEHDALTADFREPKVVGEVVRSHVARSGPIEILINNTGGPPAGPLLDAAPQAFIDAVTMHVCCNHVLAQALVPGMRERGYGRIINIISTSVRQPIPGLGVSNTIRAAVAAWAKTLAGELAPHAITVNNVLPGYTSTGRLSALIRTRAERQGVATESVEESMRRETPLGRFAAPEEIADAVAFLASDAAGYITGVSLPVDGGRIAAI